MAFNGTFAAMQRGSAFEGKADIDDTRPPISIYEFTPSHSPGVLAVHMRHHGGHVAGAGNGVGRRRLLDAGEIVRR